MAIRRSFGGQTIRKPGAYSRSRVDNTGGAPIGSNDILFLIGESTQGAPGDVEGIQSFSAERLSTLIDKYGSGPLVDCARASVQSPSRTPGISGAGQILIWKTNSSTQATLSVNEATNSNPLLTIKDRKWGVAGNNLSVTIANGSTSNQKLITVNKLNDTSELVGENPANISLSIQYTGNASTASAQVSGLTQNAKSLTTTLAGDQTDGSTNLNIALSSVNIKELADLINSQVGYSASLVTTSSASLPGNDLDSVTIADVSVSSNLYRLQREIVDLINQESERIEVELATVPVEGLPINISSQFLTGGALGASVNSDFSNGLSKSLANIYNVVVPCVSRDASDEIAAGGFTDVASTYTIASVLNATETHLRLRGSVKNRKEAQGMGGVREDAKADAFSTISSLGSELMQLTMQDVLALNEQGTLTWQQPHVLAAIMAGIRLGSAVGEPLTHKFINAAGIGHAVDPVTGIEGGDFNESLDVDEAIENGVLFAEEVAGGFRIVVDNTTYGADQSFVFNRGSVVEAAQFVAKTIRETAELVFVGQKVSNGAAESIKSVIRNKLRELNAPDVNVLTSSNDAPEGFVEETFVVEVQGNTARVQVEVKCVQGLDFIFIDFTLGDITQNA